MTANATAIVAGSPGALPQAVASLLAVRGFHVASVGFGGPTRGAEARTYDCPRTGAGWRSLADQVETAQGTPTRAATIIDGRIEVHDHPDPVPGTTQILVRVLAAAMNAADFQQLRGCYPAPPGWPADIPGLEVAGEVVLAGPGATRFAPGDRVMAVVGGGGQAELAVVSERAAMPVPGGLDWAQAGGLPEGFTTAHDALFTQAGLSLGERLLVSGGAGGVGTAGLQLGAAAGASVTATVRDPSLRAAVSELGAVAIDPAEAEEHGPFDVILELVGTAGMDMNLRSLAVGGRICVIGGDVAPAEVNLGLLMASRGRIHGSTLRYRPAEEKAAAARLVEAHVIPLFEAGRLRVPVDSAFKLEDAPAAYERFAAGGKLGKVVLLAWCCQSSTANQAAFTAG